MYFFPIPLRVTHDADLPDIVSPQCVNLTNCLSADTSILGCPPKFGRSSELV